MKAPYGLIFLPVYNDWESCAGLIQKLDAEINVDKGTYNVLVVDDCSTEGDNGKLSNLQLKHIDSIQVLRLKRNLGHQRAICVGLAHIHADYPCTMVVQMDSDGEDDPADVPRLVEQLEAENYEKIVFAQRIKRSERFFFRFFLLLYKFVHRLLTGKGISIGNFSAIPYQMLKRLVIVPELWSHYAASVLHARLPYTLVPCAREKRMAGQSKMNFTGLVMHGLSAISVYSDVVATRLLLACIGFISMVVVGFLGVVAMQFYLENVILEWLVYASAFLFMFLLQLVMFAMIFSFLILNGRKDMGFLPVKDFAVFIEKRDVLWQKK